MLPCFPQGTLTKQTCFPISSTEGKAQILLMLAVDIMANMDEHLGFNVGESWNQQKPMQIYRGTPVCWYPPQCPFRKN